MRVRTWIGGLCLALTAVGAEAQDTPTPVRPSSPVVQAESLGGLDLFQAAARRTDLPADLWKGASAELAGDVFGRLAGSPVSPAARDLALRLLATGAAAPDGGAADLDLATRRTAALLALGDAAGADAILGRTAGVAESPALSETAAEAALFLGEDEKACRIGQTLRNGRDAIYWVRLRAVCDALAGRTSAAQLGLSVLEQAPGAKDPVFGRLLNARLGAGSPGAASLRTGLQASLSRSLTLDLAAAVEGAAPAALPTLARGAGPARATAASRALRLGLITGEEARVAFAPEAPAPPADGAAAVTPPPGVADVAGAAKLTGAARDQALHRLTLNDDPAVKAAAVEALLARPDAGEFMAGARLAEPPLQALAETEVGDRAALFARAAAALGDTALATRFRAKAGEAGGFELAVTDALIGLGARRKPTPEALGPLLVLATGADEAGRGRAQRAALLLAAAGAPVPAEARSAVMKFSAGEGDAAVGRRLALDLAADAKAKGEAALVALDIALGAGAAGVKPADRIEIVRALREAGVAGWAAWLHEGLALPAAPAR